MNNLNAGLASNDVLNALLRVYGQVLDNKRSEESKKVISPLPEPYTLDTPGKRWSHWTEKLRTGESQLEPVKQVLSAMSPTPTQTPTPTPAMAQAASMSWEDFIRVAVPIFEREGYPANVGLAQAATETGRGKHAPGNAYFGIKGQGTAGTQRLKTKEATPEGLFYETDSNFAGYERPEDSVRAYIKLIKTRYPDAWEARKNPKKMLQKIHQGGYATNPKYVDIVTNTPEFRGDYGR